MNLSKNMNLEKIASNLLGSKITKISHCNDGGNSRIFKVKHKEKLYALKFYRQEKSKDNTRLQKETQALNFLSSFNHFSSPDFISSDKENNCALLEWIEGNKIEKWDKEEITQAATFIQSLEEVKNDPLAKDIGYGTDACFSFCDIEQQIIKRLNILEKSSNKLLRERLNNLFLPLFYEIIDWAKKGLNGKEKNRKAKISKEKMTLSPVDFGFHNCLRNKEGKLVFLDFEYFGWADPVNLVSDTLLHPGMNLSLKKRNQIFQKLKIIYINDQSFLNRMKIFYPLYELRWCVIMLNVFAPDYFKFYPQTISENEKEKMLRERVQNTKRRLIHLKESYSDFPYR